MIKPQSILDQLAAALRDNKRLKEQIKKLEVELKEAKRLISLTYDAQNG